MIASQTDTAELARSTRAPVSSGRPSSALVVTQPVVTQPDVAATRDPVPEAVVGEPEASPRHDVPATPGRRAMREERRHQRRQQRWYAAAGVTFLALVFLVAVIVLGGIR